MFDPTFTLVIDTRTITIPCDVVPNLVIAGSGWQSGIVCSPVTVTGDAVEDAFLLECLAYQINEGSGLFSSDAGVIERGDSRSDVTWFYSA